MNHKPILDSLATATDKERVRSYIIDWIDEDCYLSKNLYRFELRRGYSDINIDREMLISTIDLSISIVDKVIEYCSLGFHHIIQEQVSPILFSDDYSAEEIKHNVDTIVDRLFNEQIDNDFKLLIDEAIRIQGVLNCKQNCLDRKRGFLSSILYIMSLIEEEKNEEPEIMYLKNAHSIMVLILMSDSLHT